MSAKEKVYLNEEVVVTEDNVMELKGEIEMYKDLLAGRLQVSDFRTESIDVRLTIMFSHLKQEYRGRLKEKLLANPS
jgi:hypothetical protein